MQRIQALNAQLRSTPAATARSVLVERALLLDSLMPEGYDAVAAVRLTPAERQRLVAAVPDAASLIEDDVELTGLPKALVADDFKGHRSSTYWMLVTDSDKYRLFFGAQLPPTELDRGLPLKVLGLRSAHNIAVKEAMIGQIGLPSHSAQSLVPASTAASGPGCSTTGVQNIAVLMVTTPANPTFPAGWDENFLQTHFFGSTGLGLNTYWQQTSYEQTSTAGAVYGPFALTNNYTCGTDDEQLMTDAVAAASSTVNFSLYSRVAVVFPVQSCTYGGLGSVGCGPGPGVIASQTVSEAWFPIFPTQPTSEFVSITAHEFGHNLGLNHGNTDDYGATTLGPLDEAGVNTEYGDDYTVMGADYNVSGEYVGQHKATILGWLPYGAYEEISTSGIYTMSPLENPGGVKTLHILRDAVTGAGLWLEYRQPLGIVDTTFENFAAGQSNVYAGATVHLQDPNLDALHTYLLDFQPNALPNAFTTSAFVPGQTWSDPYSLLTLSASAGNATGMAITVSYDAPCATLQVSSASFTAAGGTGTITVTAPSTCAWTATTADDWMMITAGASGSGNGSVAFKVAASQMPTQQTGFITVQRQSLPIVQAGTGGIVVAPGSNTPVQGTSGHFIFTVADAAGPSDVNNISFNFNGLAQSGCSILTYGQAYLGSFYLVNDAGTQYLTFSNGSVSNSQCTLFSDSTESISGNTITVNLHIQFAAGTAGTHVGSAYVSNAANTNVGPFNAGSWQVPFTGAVASINKAFANYGKIVVGTTVTHSVPLVNTGGAALKMTSVTFTGSNPSQFSQTNNCGQSLAIGATCTYKVTFAPTTQGTVSATMNITDSANGSPQILMLQGVGEYALGVTPASIAFENEIVGTSSPATTVTLTNQGASAVPLSAPAISGTSAANFTLTNQCPAQLAAAANCTVTVAFKPSAVGAVTASLSLGYTLGTGTYAVPIALAGTGVSTVSAPVLSLVSGTYAGTQHLTLTDQTANTHIYYTTNGATPTTASTLYTAPVTIAGTTTVNAIAAATGSTASPVTTGNYVIVTPAKSHTALTVTPSSVASGTLYTLKAKVTVGGVIVTSGTVTFYDGSVVLGTADVNSAGVATLRTFSLVPGADQMEAVFNHDNLAAASTSAVVPVTVANAYATTTSLSNSGTQGNYDLTATVASFGAGTPTGSITFNDTSTSTVLGTAAVSNFHTVFTGTTSVPQSSNAQDVALGDVNGDGIPDMVVASYNGGANWISVAHGKGDGTFAKAVAIATLAGDNNGGPAVALADLNGDGKLDVIGASWAGYGLAVFMGNGNGTFGPEVDFPVDGGYANSIAVGDFNGDGKLDVVTSDPFGNSISVLLGNGDGTFSPEKPFPTDTTPEAVTVGDFNKDGRLDIAVANTTGTVSIFLGNGDGTFQVLPPVVVSSSGHFVGPKAIATGDFNGDGKADLVISIWDSESAGILLGNGDGTFKPVQLFPAPGATPTGVAVGDINRDGVPDIAISSYNGSVATVLMGTGGGEFQTASYPVANGAGSVGLADFNGDGLLDLVSVSATTNAVSVRLAQTNFSAIITDITLPGSGSDTVSASYAGNGTFAPSTSSTLTLPSKTPVVATPTPTTH